MLEPEYNFDEIKEECGIFGIYSQKSEDVARLTYFGLHALQHRGQESAGIAVADGLEVALFKDMGLVTQVFKEEVFQNLQGFAAIGHVRYSTTGSTVIENAQPILRDSAAGKVALAHNGNLVNVEELRDEMMAAGSEFVSTSDSEVMLTLIASRIRDGIEQAIEYAMSKVKGGYSVLFLTKEKLVGFRDPYGIRPLSIGKIQNGYVLSSETCGLDIVGAEYIRDVEPGEIVIVDKNGIFSVQGQPNIKSSLCIFEFVYFARPDSFLYGKNLYEARKEMGYLLAEEAPVKADLIIPVPDSGTPAAAGFAERSGIPFSEGLIKNRYVGRTFIQPAQELRQLGIKMKLNPLKAVINGKRLVIVDDSIVRGNTSRKIVQLLKEAGAKEVHMRVSSPPVKYPCFYGIDTANRRDLIASEQSVEEIRKYIGADSLEYLSIEALVKSTGSQGENFCSACFDGFYPIRIPDDLKISKFKLER